MNVSQQGGISTGSYKAKFKKLGAKSREPSSGSLLEPVEGFAEFADMSWIIRLDKPRRLDHKNSLDEITMQKGVLYVQLSHRPASSDGQGKNKANCSRAHNRAECFRIVETMLLMKSFSNKAGFPAFNTTISQMFSAKNPFTPNKVLRSR